MSVETETLLAPSRSAGQKGPVEAAQSLAWYIQAKTGKLSPETAKQYASQVLSALDSGEYPETDWDEKLGIEEGNPLGRLVLRTLSGAASENDIVLECSKQLESVLRDEMGADGRGLHEYTTDAEDRLPEPLVKALRWVASVRNAVVHGDGSGLEDTHARAQYVLQAARAWDWLQKVAANFDSPVKDSQSFSTATSSGRKNMSKVQDVVVSITVMLSFLVGVYGSVQHGLAWGIFYFFTALFVTSIPVYAAYLLLRPQMSKSEEGKSKNKKAIS